MVTKVTALQMNEVVYIDREALVRLGIRHGPTAGEEVLFCTTEQLAQHLALFDKVYLAADWLALGAALSEFAKLADLLGMLTLVRASHALQDCIARGDDAASAALLARIYRVGERSLEAVFRLHGLSMQ